MKNTSKKIVSNTQARVRLPTENEAPTGEGMRLSGYRTKNAFFSISNLRKPKSIAVTSRNSLVWTVLHIKYNMGSKREDPKCCKPRIKYTIWINAFQKILGIENIGNQENLICLCSTSFFLSKETRYWLLQALGGTQDISFYCKYNHVYICDVGLSEPKRRPKRGTDPYRPATQD